MYRTYVRVRSRLAHSRGGIVPCYGLLLQENPNASLMRVRTLSHMRDNATSNEIFELRDAGDVIITLSRVKREFWTVDCIQRRPHQLCGHIGRGGDRSQQPPSALEEIHLEALLNDQNKKLRDIAADFAHWHGPFLQHNVKQFEGTTLERGSTGARGRAYVVLEDPRPTEEPPTGTSTPAWILVEKLGAMRCPRRVEPEDTTRLSALWKPGRRGTVAGKWRRLPTRLEPRPLKSPFGALSIGHGRHGGVRKCAKQPAR
ncbi:hypothetical protein C8Q78DRAFT_994051 [Trametes maxima]|nr:hypothetical protein C8Q78DRAFT_994051 [Trametes maxima]